MAIYVSENYNKANSTTSVGTPQTGPAWTNTRGVWGIETNQGYCADNLVGEASCTIDDGRTVDFLIEADMKGTISASSNNQIPALCVKMVDQFKLIYVHLIAGRLKMFAWDTSGEVWADVAVPATLDNTYYHVRAEYTSTQIRLYVDSVLYATYTMTSAQQTRWNPLSRKGMRQEKNGTPAGNTARWDNYVVSDIGVTVHSVSGSAAGVSGVTGATVRQHRPRNNAADGKATVNATAGVITSGSGQADGAASVVSNPVKLMTVEAVTSTASAAVAANPVKVLKAGGAAASVSGVSANTVLVKRTGGTAVSAAVMAGSAIKMQYAVGQINAVSTVPNVNPTVHAPGQADVVRGVSTVSGIATVLYVTPVPVGPVRIVSAAVGLPARVFNIWQTVRAIATVQAVARQVFSAVCDPIAIRSNVSLTKPLNNVYTATGVASAASSLQGNSHIEIEASGAARAVGSITGVPNRVFVMEGCICNNVSNVEAIASLVTKATGDVAIVSIVDAGKSTVTRWAGGTAAAVSAVSAGVQTEKNGTGIAKSVSAITAKASKIMKARAAVAKNVSSVSAVVTLVKKAGGSVAAQSGASAAVHQVFASSGAVGVLALASGNAVCAMNAGGAVQAVSVASGAATKRNSASGAAKGRASISAMANRVRRVGGSAVSSAGVSAKPNRVRYAGGGAAVVSIAGALAKKIMHTAGAAAGMMSVAATPTQVIHVVHHAGGQADGKFAVTANPTQVIHIVHHASGRADGAATVSGSPVRVRHAGRVVITAQASTAGAARRVQRTCGGASAVSTVSGVWKDAGLNVKLVFLEGDLLKARIGQSFAYERVGAIQIIAKFSTDPTGHSFTWTLRRNGEIVMTKVSGGGVASTPYYVTVSLSAADVQTIEPGDYEYELTVGASKTMTGHLVARP